MSFTMFSAALLAVVGAGVFAEAVRGLRRGLARTAVTLASVVFSALTAIPLAVWLSDLLCKRLGNLFLELVPVLGTLGKQFPSVPTLLTAGVDTLISPVLFVLLFLILRLVTRIIVAALFRKRLTPAPDDPADPMYEGENAPFHRRHGRLLSGITGGLCGFLAALMLLSPVVGVLSAAGTVLKGTEEMKVKWSTMGINEEMIASVRSYTDDPAVLLLDAAGGGLIFDAAACTHLNGRRVYLSREVDTCMAALSDLLIGVSVLNHVSTATEEELDALAHLGNHIAASEAAKSVSADFLNVMAKAWLEGKTFMKISKPAFGELVDPLLTGILQVCADSDASCVARDITTFLNIFLIAAEYGLLSDPDYDQLAQDLGADGVLGLIFDELDCNPCTAHLTDELSNMSLRIMASAIDASGFTKEQMNGLMGDLSDALNRVNGMGNSPDEQVESMKEYTMYYAEQYGVTIPESLAEVAAIALVDKMADAGGKLTADDLTELFEQYMSGG